MLQMECGDQAETDVIVDTLIDKELAVYVRLRGPDSCAPRSLHPSSHPRRKY